MTGWMRKRWRKWAVVVAGVMTVAPTGCTKQLYMTPETQHIASSVGLPADLATNPGITAIPDVSDHKAPPTVLDANREARYMTLQESLAISLERGNRGNTNSFYFQNFGGGQGVSFTDDLVQFTGRGVNGDDAIRAFALDPAIAAADIEGALSKFDARILTSMTWRKQDQAVANIFNNFNNGDFATLNAGLYKPLPTGGVAGITVDMNYSYLGAAPQGFQVINPSYTPALTFQFEQPLLRDSGIDINQLMPQHPGSTQINGLRPSGGRGEGILITRIRADQAKAELERELNALVFNVEVAYWTLYSRYYAKYAAEQALRQAYTTWDQLQQLQVAGLQTKQGVAQARAQLEEFRNGYLSALQSVFEAERRFRGVVGLPLEDGKRVVPSDTPTLAPVRPDWSLSLAETLTNRPELQMARHELKVQQLNVMLQQNNTRPDLRFFANYNMNGIGPRLDGPGPIPTVNALGQVNEIPGNAIKSFLDNRFNNWQVGLRFDMPIGNRDAHASLKVAQLQLARSHVVLRNQERKAEFFLSNVYQQLVAYHEQIKLQRARRVALGEQLEGQFERVKIGKDPIIQLLDAQRNFASSIQAEADATVNYNIAIAGFQYAKGSILPFNNITIGEGALPAAIAERAADHFAARSAALKLRERPATGFPTEATMPGSLPGFVESGTGPLPETIEGAKPSSTPPIVNPTPIVPIPNTPIPLGPAPGMPLPSAPLPMVPTPQPLPSIPLRPVSVHPPTTTGLPVEGPVLEGPALPSKPVSRFRPQ